MQGPEFEQDYDAIEVDEEQEEVNPYTTWVTLAGLILAISMLGSLILRAFPPHVIFDGFSRESDLNTPMHPVAVRVAAEAGWVDTGVDLAGNSGYRLSARGQVLINGPSGADEPVDPGGLELRCQPTGESNCALDDAPYGALIARVGSGDAFVVGDLAVVETIGSGRLWLAVNDLMDSYGDNGGHFIVRLEPFDASRFDTAFAFPSSPSN